MAEGILCDYYDYYCSCYSFDSLYIIVIVEPPEKGPKNEPEAPEPPKSRRRSACARMVTGNCSVQFTHVGSCRGGGFCDDGNTDCLPRAPPKQIDADRTSIRVGFSVLTESPQSPPLTGAAQEAPGALPGAWALRGGAGSGLRVMLCSVYLRG